MAPTEGTPYDVIDAHGGRWEVRSLTDRGIYFCPSHMVGSSRNFNERGFMAKLDGIDGYLVSDIEQFPAVPYWVVRTACGPPSSTWPSALMARSISCSQARRDACSLGRKIMPTPYSPGGGSVTPWAAISAR